MREDETGAKNVLILLLLFDHSVIFFPIMESFSFGKSEMRL